jgi:hypothetical protein
MRRAFIAGLAFVLAPLCARAQSAPPAGAAPSALPALDDAASLFATAIERTNLLASGTVPFHMRAQLKCNRSKGKPIEGVYDLWWVSGGRWRAEITVGGSTSVILQEAGKRWDKLNDEQQLLDLRLSKAMDMGYGLHLYQGERVTKVERHELDGAAANCFELTHSGKATWQFGETFQFPSYRREVCLDAAAGLPLRKKEDFSGREFEYGDYVALAMRRVPRHMLYKLNGKLLLDAQVGSLDVLLNPDAKLFAPPDQAPSFALCGDFTQATPAARSPITGGRSELMPGTAPSLGAVTAVSFVIGADGKVRDFTILDRQGFSQLVDRQLEALRKGLYHPATCGGAPVDFPVVMEVRVSPEPVKFTYMRGG